MTFHFDSTKLAGLIGLSWGDETPESVKPLYCLHLGTKPSFWVWGRKHTMQGADLVEYGFGPLFLLVICYGQT